MPSFAAFQDPVLVGGRSQDCLVWCTINDQLGLMRQQHVEITTLATTMASKPNNRATVAVERKEVSMRATQQGRDAVSVEAEGAVASQIIAIRKKRPSCSGQTLYIMDMSPAQQTAVAAASTT